MKAVLHNVLCSLLADAIRGRPARITLDLSPREWDRLMAVALQHDILALLYPAAAGLPPGTIPNDRLVRWRHHALQAGIQEVRRFHEALAITDAFAARALPCVAFKGMVLRALYPQPDLRTMGDIDLLIRPHDLPAVEVLLLERGLQPMGANAPHYSWRFGPSLIIELHTALFRHSPASLEESFLAGAVARQADSRTYFVPPPEDAAVYQVLHMAKHFLHLGFGLRELADFTLQMERGLSIPGLLERLDVCGTGRFGRAVLLAARQELGHSLPEETTSAWNIPREAVDRLSEAILSAGTHGMTNAENSLSLAAGSRVDGSVPDSGPPARWRFLGWLLFPSTPDLHPRYAYVTSHRYLLPVAWIHRLVRTAILTPAVAFTSLRFGLRYLLKGSRLQQLQADLGLLHP
jgi:hypothetical protein